MLPQIQEYLRAGQTPHQVDPNGWRRRIPEANGGVVVRNWNPTRRDGAIYTGAKRCCRMGKQDDLQMNSCHPRRYRSPKGTVGGTRMRHRPSQKAKPNVGAQGNDTLRGVLQGKAQYIPPCCNQHETLCPHCKKENAKVGPPQFRRNYGRMWRIPSISNLDPLNKQDQGILGCPFCGRRNKEHSSSWNSGRIQ